MRRLDWLKLWLHGLLHDVLPPPAECADGLGGGLGLGLRVRRGKPFSPADLFAGGAYAGFWADLDAPDAITYTTQPLSRDLDFEEAGVSAWNAMGGATLAKEVVGAHGGTQWMSVSGASGAYARPAVLSGDTCKLVIGNTYRLRCWIKGDGGVCQPRVWAGAFVAVGTTSAGWQYFDATFTATSAELRLYIYGGGAAGFDSFVIEQLSVTSVALKNTTATATQLTAANMPYAKALGAKQGLYFAVEDGLPIGTDKATQRWLHDGTGCTLSILVYLDALAATRTLLASADTDAGVGCLLQVATNGAITYSVFNGTAGTPFLTCTSAAGAIVASTKALMTVRMNSSGCQVYVDGLLVASDATPTGAANAGDATNLVKVGNLSGGYTAGAAGQLVDPYAVAKYASDAELRDLHRYFANKHSIKLVTDAF